jgi:alpha,alpha-trehalase
MVLETTFASRGGGVAVLIDALAAAAMNDVCLLAEEVDPASGEMIGNFPQAFSHAGLVNAAWAIDQSRQSTSAT